MIKELTKIANEIDRRGLQKEADALDKIIKEAASTYSMIDYDLRVQEENKIARLVLNEAMRRANRNDISKEMRDEFYEDAVSDVVRIISDTTSHIKSFNMDATLFDQEALDDRDEPTEIDEPAHRGNPNDPWDALFPPKK
jgi:hypothetical protein